MKSASTGLILAVLLGLYLQNASAAPPSEDAVRIPSVTRSVQAFSKLESEIITALKHKNQVKLAQLVDQNFDMQVASGSANFVARSEWLKASMAEAASYTYDISDMAVRDLGQTAIVSFDWKPSESIKKGSSPEIFIVDVWKKEGMDWKLAIRFASALQKSGLKFPGFSVTDGVIEKKY
jgi:hypothetical protein